MRELVGGEAAGVARRAGLARGELEELGRVRVVAVFVAVEAGERFVELRPVGVVPDAALEEVAANVEVFALRFDSQREARLALVVQCGRAGVPRHVPCGHIPEEGAARLEGSDLAEQEEDARPLGALPCDVRLDEQEVGNDGAEAAQSGKHAELPDLLAQVEAQPQDGGVVATATGGKRVLDRHFGGAEEKQRCDHGERAFHSSRPENTAAASSR